MIGGPRRHRLRPPVRVVAYGLGFSLAAGAGLYLRWVDHERRRDLDLVRQDERLAIAQELHDVVAHHITGIVVQAQAAQAVWPEQPEVAPDALARIEAAGAEALRSMRRLVSTLRADEVGPLAPAATLADLQVLADRSTAMGLPVHLHLDGVDELPPSVAPSIHRVVGEAITNAQRHATGATAVDVRVRGGRRRAHGRGGRRRRRHPRGAVGGARLRPHRHGRAHRGAGRTVRGRPRRRRGLAHPRPPAPRGDRVTAPLRVVIADDQEMVRSGFRLILEANGIEVVGEATNGVEAVRLGRDLRPDVCLLDIRMPELDGLEATRQLAGPDVVDPIAVVVVTTFDLDEYVRTAIDNGASGFLLKDAGAALLVEAVRAAANGDALVSPSITVRFLAHFGGVREAPPQPPVTPLTEREEELLVEVAKGSTNAEIGAALHISLSTVKTHLGSIQAKLGARNRVEVAAWAWQTGRMRDRP